MHELSYNHKRMHCEVPILSASDSLTDYYNSTQNRTEKDFKTSKLLLNPSLHIATPTHLHNPLAKD